MNIDDPGLELYDWEMESPIAYDLGLRKDMFMDTIEKVITSYPSDDNGDSLRDYFE